MYFVRTGIDYKDNLDGTYILQEDLQLVLDNNHIIRVPRGFVWNGASIPRIMWRVCGSPMVPENVRASCVHDWLYSRKRIPTRHFSRKECDNIFYQILRKDGKSWAIAKLMLYAVNVFGRYHFRKEYMTIHN